MSNDPGRPVPHHGSGGSSVPPMWVVLCKAPGVDLIINVEAYGPFWTHDEALRFAGARKKDAAQSIQLLTLPSHSPSDVSSGTASDTSARVDPT